MIGAAASQPASGFSVLGRWIPGQAAAAFHPAEILQLAPQVRIPIHIVRNESDGRIGIAEGGQVIDATPNGSVPSYELLATLPPLFPEWLGDRSFLAVHGVRFPYIAGEMANGIATATMVASMARAGMLGFFGAAGLSLERIEHELDAIEADLRGTELPWGSNLIHNLAELGADDAVVSLYLRRNVRRVSTSAFMSLTPAVARFASNGLYLDSAGRIQRRNHVFAKLSSPEVARQFMSPAPPAMLATLVAQGALTAEEARLAAHVAVAEDITVEADSGGHTDNRPLGPLFSTILELSRQMMEHHRLARPIRVGAAGGLGTPGAVASAFALGAAYILTGSINQAAVESGLSTEGKRMLAEVGLTDVTMAPAADMFELGVKVQVVKRGTMFPLRARQLYDAYREHASLEQIPPEQREKLERDIFRAPLEEIWQQTEAYFASRDPEQIVRAHREPKHRMALVFRWYLGNSSRWAVGGDLERRVDYQMWCGPAMGAFNAWVAGSFLAKPEARTAPQIALNLLEGAAIVTRAQQLRTYGVAVPPAAFHYRPRVLS